MVHMQALDKENGREGKGEKKWRTFLGTTNFLFLLGQLIREGNKELP